MIVAWTIAALLGFMFITAAFQFSMAIVGRIAGVHVQEVAVGVSGKLIGFRVFGMNCRINWFPLGGYTKFLATHLEDDADFAGTDEDADHHSSDDADKIALDQVSVLARLAILVVGPLSNVVLGAVLLWLPIQAQQPQLVFDSNVTAMADLPAALEAAKSSPPSNWTGQWELVQNTGLFYTQRLATFRSLDGWGGPVAGIVSIGRAGDESIWHGCSMLGVLGITLGIVNFMPIPMLNGFQILSECCGIAVRSPAGSKLRIYAFMAGLMFILVLFCRMLWLDFQWIF